jgi:hypothetical protein
MALGFLPLSVFLFLLFLSFYLPLVPQVLPLAYKREGLVLRLGKFSSFHTFTSLQATHALTRDLGLLSFSRPFVTPTAIYKELVAQAATNWIRDISPEPV